MVCKRSLYCWKNGPCASDQTRKQIWEDNIRFRESLRDINQSDHYWSFQISKTRCLCLEGEEIPFGRPLSQKYRSASLHNIDCTSVTHDFNGLKFRNCYVHCPYHTETKRVDTPIPQSLTKKENLSSVKYPIRPLHKSDEDKSEYCHRYKNTLTNSKLKPSMKTKFLSQSNLTDSKSSEKKVTHSSCEDIQKATEVVKKSESKKTDCEVQTDLIKPKKKELKPLKCITELSPISRTTRKMLSENKKTPFATYGCNNKNIDIGSKRTHNVLVSKMEVYPNALTAKQQKRNQIMKYIQSEKEFQKKCLPEELQRRINHSSLWSLDAGKTQRKNGKYLLPIVTKKNPVCSQVELGSYRNYRKPQIYFY